jgi:Big-like domain-containing protein
VNGTLAVVRGAIDVTVVTSPEPSGLDGPMTFTASVSAAAPAAGNPSGSVRFFDGATLVGTAPLTGGAATLSTAGLDAGVRTIQAQYDGDGSFEPGTDSASHVIRDASQTPSVAVSSSRNPSSSGQSVTLTATVTMPAGGVNGQVEFYDGAALLGSSAISAGRATFATASLAVGSHAVTARYTGGNGVPPARSEVFVQAVGTSGWKNRATSMVVTATPNPAVLGDSVTVTADVSGSSGAPTGRILFMVDGAVVADVAVTARSASAARATLAVPGLAHGRHTISATYLGDPTYKGSTNRLTAVVN